MTRRLHCRVLRAHAAARAALPLLRVRRPARRRHEPAFRHDELRPHSARPCSAPLEPPRRRAPAQARGREPDALVQGPDRVDGWWRRQRGVRVRDALLRLDRQPRRGGGGAGCCRRARSGRSIAADSVDAAPTSSFGARVFEVDGTFDECRELERQLEGALPVGLPRRKPARGRLEGAEDDRVRAGGAARRRARRRRRSSGVRDAAGEARAGLGEAGLPPRLYERRPAGARRSRPRGQTDRPLSRCVRRPRCARSRSATRPTASSRSARRACRAARSRACRRRRSPTCTALLAETTGTLADSAGRALGALLELVRTARSARASGSCSSSPGPG